MMVCRSDTPSMDASRSDNAPTQALHHTPLDKVSSSQSIDAATNTGSAPEAELYDADACDVERLTSDIGEDWYSAGDEDGDSDYVCEEDEAEASSSAESSASASIPSVCTRRNTSRKRKRQLTFANVANRDDHGAWKCDVSTCDRLLESKAAYELHVVRYHTRSERGRTYACSRCGDRFATRHEQLVHRGADHSFLCDFDGCGMSFADEERAIQHVEEWHGVHDGEPFACPECDEAFLTRHDLKLHRKDVKHERVFVCHVATCGQVYKKKDKYRRHMDRYHQEAPSGAKFACRRCSEAYETRHELELHSAAAHASPASSVELPRSPSFPCDVEGCGKSYSKREHLRRHMRTAHEAPEEKPFKCELCGVRFVHKHGLTRHHANCHADDAARPYSCSVCLLAFKKKSLLQAHSYVHTGVLPFECADCGERFLKRFQLVRHERSHNGASKPSQTQVLLCEDPDCDELFFSLEEKQQHAAEVHGDVHEAKIKPEHDQVPSKKQRSVGRELRCLVCDRHFDRVHNLRCHLRTHFDAVDERKLHLCPLESCGRSYTRKSNVMAHYNAVHDPTKSRRFKCPFEHCDGAFGYKKVLETHIASVHRKIEQQDSNALAERTTSSPPKRRGRQAIGVLERALGLNQVGEELIK